MNRSPLSAESTHRKSGGKGPIPIPICTGRSIKSRPSSPGRCLCARCCPAGQMEAAGDRPGGPASRGALGQSAGPMLPRGEGPCLAPGGGGGGPGQAHVVSARSAREAWVVPQVQRRGCRWCPEVDWPALGHPFWRNRPCGVPRSFCCCGFWCWQQVAVCTPTGPAAGYVQLGLPRAPSPSLSCSVCTSPSSPPVMGTGPAAPTGPSTGLSTAAVALGWAPPGLAMPAALAGRGPVGSLGPVQQQYASRRAGTEGAVSGPATATAPQDGRATPATQTWMSAAPAGLAVPRAA
ncbi:epidermal growth factor-like protein 7 isoform X1 [Fukomys damarensis]|uniref:epidermal growth factor-like protein 7 isoform X1 n=1 Tax=Fukomys damarensis TaxID=885580 RepID=UPI00053FC151|nr:epidermal growth factor-like protein 7 isoform X1 [Fukomys damarensis]